MALRTLSCFTGGYGLDLGLEIAFSGLLEPVMYVEIDVQAAGFLASLQEEGFIPRAPVWSDMRTVGDAACRAYLRRRAGTKTIRGAVQAIAGGYPCPDFSIAGKRRGFGGEKGKLWFALRDAIRLYRPDVAFLENVGGHLLRGFQRVRRELREMGYHVEAGLFTAEEVGDTQKRERLFILACKPGFRWREGRSSTAGQEGRSYAPQCDTELACRGRASLNADQSRWQRGPSGQVEAMRSGASEDLALPDAEGLQGRGQPEREGSEQCAAEEGSPSLASTPGWNARNKGGRFASGTDIGGGCGELARYPLFPPGPDSLDDWLDVLRRDPWLAPAVGKAAEPTVRRLAHGLARVDALRLYGNGVVPLQAAYAFRTLAAALERRLA